MKYEIGSPCMMGCNIVNGGYNFAYASSYAAMHSDTAVYVCIFKRNDTEPFYELELHKTMGIVYSIFITGINIDDCFYCFKENEEYYKILYNNKMVGFIGIKNYEKEIYLYRFFIDEKYRNNGIGTIALNQIIELAKFENKDLSLEVIGENIARDLYERLGFKTHYRRMILKINDDIYEN